MTGGFVTGKYNRSAAQLNRHSPLLLRHLHPGNKNNWYLEIWGTKACVRWSSKQINTLEVLEYKDGQQSWQNIDMGHEVAYKLITGEIFQMGFSDSILQMWAAFCCELVYGKPPKKFAGCVTPQEVAISHSLFTAALESNKSTFALFKRLILIIYKQKHIDQTMSLLETKSRHGGRYVHYHFGLDRTSSTVFVDFYHANQRNFPAADNRLGSLYNSQNRHRHYTFCPVSVICSAPQFSTSEMTYQLYPRLHTCLTGKRSPSPAAHMNIYFCEKFSTREC